MQHWTLFGCKFDKKATYELRTFVHHCNIQKVAIEMFKVLNDLHTLALTPSRVCDIQINGKYKKLRFNKTSRSVK